MVDIINDESDIKAHSETEKHKKTTWKAVKDFSSENGWYTDTFMLGKNRININDIVFGTVGVHVTIKKENPSIITVHINRKDFHDKGMELVHKIEEATKINVKVDLKYTQN